MTENNPIFENIFLALRVAYIMEILQRSVPNCITILQQMNYCYTYTRGNNNIHFNGLSDLEIHAQCALIRNIVEKQLPYLLTSIIVAKYAINDIFIEKIYKKNKIKIKLQQTLTKKRLNAIKYIAEQAFIIYFQVKNIPQNLVEMLTIYHFDKKLFDQRDLSILQLSQKFNIPKSNLYYYLKKLQDFIKDHETKAIQQLSIKLSQKQIIPNSNANSTRI